MKNLKKISILFASSVLLVAAGFFCAQIFFGASNKQEINIPNDASQNIINSDQKSVSSSEQKDEPLQKSVPDKQGVWNSKVPFIVQAPFANWSDQIFQNACEESSIVMAMGWLNNLQSISAQNANAQILDIVKFEDSAFSYNADTDVNDVATIFQKHFQKNVLVKEDIALQDIVDQLKLGNLVLVPAFGQALGNPNYTPPGPIAHMLVITGYDSNSQKFITSDPGTKRGEGYQYDKNVLFNAIWEYPSGKGPLDQPTKGSQKKAMVVVSRN